MRIAYWLVAAILSSGMLIVACCKKEQPVAKTSPQAVNITKLLIGTYSGTQMCGDSGSVNSNITITSTGDTSLQVYNLYNTGKNFTATATDSLDANILAQNFINGSTDEVIQGSFSLKGDTLSLNLIITTFSSRRTCSAVLVKQP